MKIQSDTFTIYEVEDIQKEFTSLLLNDGVVQVDMADVSKIDMCAIQLLISLKKSCDEISKEFVLVNVNDEVMNSFEISGTGYILGV